MSHQLYGKPSYHMKIRGIGVQYMRKNPQRFIESNTDHSWLRYSAYMSHQGSWADAIVMDKSSCVGPHLIPRPSLRETTSRLTELVDVL